MGVVRVGKWAVVCTCVVDGATVVCIFAVVTMEKKDDQWKIFSIL